MDDIINNIILLKQRLTNIENVEFGIRGNIVDLKSNDINVIINIWKYIDDIFSIKKGDTIYQENVNNFLAQDICLTIKIGDVPNYYENFSDFLSGNKIKCDTVDFMLKN